MLQQSCGRRAFEFIDGGSAALHCVGERHPKWGQQSENHERAGERVPEPLVLLVCRPVDLDLPPEFTQTRHYV